MIRTIFLRASSAVSLAIPFFAAPAVAQTAPATDSSTGIEEIIVTATKRDENLVQVPISVNVVTELAIAERGITRPADFLGTTPNVTFIEDNAGEAYINIRGQTSVRNSDPNVAIVIDGVTLSSVKPFNQDLFGIQQIEVLKGPQSALYGRNAAAGAIVITTKKPSDEFEGNVVAAYGNFDTKRISSTISGPLTEGLGFTLAGSFRDTDGPFTNVVTGEKVHRFTSYNGRGRLLYDNGDGLTIDLKLGGHKSRGGGSAYNAQIAGTGIGGLPANPPVLDANYANMDFVSNVRGVFRENFFDATLKIDYDFDWATLTSISAYNRLNQYFASDSPPYVPDTGTVGANVQQYTYLDKNYSQEVRLTSGTGGPLQWQVGFYYLRFTRDQTSKISIDSDGLLPDDPRVIDPAGSPRPTLSFSNPLYRTTSYAPFASVQFNVTDQLRINLAGRYDTEKRTISEAASAAINPLTGVSYNNCIALTGKPIDECDADRTFKQFEPKASVSYEISSDASVYASYGKGFKSGGFNPIGSREALIAAAEDAGLPASSVYVQDGFDKEISTSYEIGAKARLLDRRLSVNAAVFKTNISGAQQFEFYPTVGLQTTIGIDKVKLKGFDIDFDLQLPTGTRLFGGYGYTHGRVSDFAGNPAFNGNVAPGAFKSTLNLGASQTIELGGDLSLVPRVEYNHYGSIWWDVANTPGTRRKPLSLLKARLSLKSGDRWEISAYGDNLTNEKYFQEVVPLLGFFTVNYRGPTRSYGMEARLNF
ncbi:TonB-dependent receptor [Sphingosinicella soli]|uniref:Iron complex outermembrane receptor protein n=1 Tax=Sphingosinicella soli TaxID=333708 RepID=A0A7W7B530_9SPHN|nr:TonB-dependent receptor [Sphingosinicella soli]MBB4633303.1 iron complex outermembrane receptor protein [Sphingosinicella soli]